MKNYFRLAAVSLVLVFVVTAIGLAQEPAQDPASGLQISPTRSELTIEQGKAGTVEMSIKNITAGDIIAKPEINDFEADNDTGSPRLITDQSEPTANSIQNFISDIGDIRLKSDETRNLKINVSVPKDQPAGGYFGVIRFKAFPISNVDDNPDQAVSLTASVGHIVLVEVPGEITERITLLSLRAEKGGQPGSIFADAPDKLGLEIKNEGNGFAKPFGTVNVEDFGGNEVYRYEINNTQPRGNVLPNSTRIFRDEIKNISSAFGRYTATASVSYGSGGEVLMIKSTFWIIPLWLRILAIIVVAAVVYAIVRVYRKLRENKRGYKKKR